MRQYRWFHNRIGKTIYREDLRVLLTEKIKIKSWQEFNIKDRDNAFATYIAAFRNDWHFYDLKEIKKLK